MEEFTTSYINLKDNVIQIGEKGAKFTDMWVKYMYNTMMNVMSELAKNDEEGAKKAFLDALNTAKKNSRIMIDEMCEMTSKQVGDAYMVGYNEGANMANSLNSKTMRKLIAEGALKDPDGRIEGYLKIADRVHADAFKEMMKGKTLNVYTGGKGGKGGKNGTKED